MTRLPRLGVACAAALAFLASAAQTARAAEPDKLLPASADTVVYVNFKQLIDAEVVKKYALDQIKQALAGQDAKKLLEEMGLDPMKDVETVWVGMSGSGKKDENGEEKDPVRALLVVRGKFDPEKLLKGAEALAKKDGEMFSVVREKGIGTMFKYQPDQGNPVYATVLDDATVVAGTDKKLIADAQKQFEDKDKKKAPIKPELAEIIKQMDAKASVFAAALVKGKLNDVKLPAQEQLDLSGLEKALPNMETVAVVLRVGADVNLELAMGMKDEDAAEDMGAAVSKLIKDLEGLVPILVAFEPKAKPLADVMKTVSSDVKKKTVTVKGKMTGDVLGKLINPDG